MRIKRDGSIPADNPFVGKLGQRPETWSFGHRNPQGAAINPTTGKIWINEHGARGGDEINIPLSGRNYGWPIISYGVHYSGSKIGLGTHKKGMEQPIYYWDPSIAPSGMAFYTGSMFPEWKNSLLISALVPGDVRRIQIEDTLSKEEILFSDLGRVRDIEVSPDGSLILATDGPNGKLIRVIRGN